MECHQIPWRMIPCDFACKGFSMHFCTIPRFKARLRHQHENTIAEAANALVEQVLLILAVVANSLSAIANVSFSC